MKKTFSFLIFMAIAGASFAQTVADEIPAVVEDCLTCLPNIINQNWPAAIGCLATAVIAGVVRYFEKKKDKKKK